MNYEIERLDTWENSWKWADEQDSMEAAVEVVKQFKKDKPSCDYRIIQVLWES